MKICIVTEYFPPRIIGGGEYAANNLARSLARHGQTVDVLTSHRRLTTPAMTSGESPIHEIKDGMTIHRILGLKTLKLKSLDLTGFSVHEFFFLHAMITLVSFAKTEKPDLIHALNIDSIPPAVLAGKICRIPVIVTINANAIKCPKGDMMRSDGGICYGKCDFLSSTVCLTHHLRHRKWRGLHSLETFFWWSIIRFFARRADKIVAISKFLQKILVQEGFPAKRIEVIPEMIDLDFLESDIDTVEDSQFYQSFSGGKVVLYAGAIFDSRKGSETLIEAMPFVLEKIPNAKFVISGRIPDRERRMLEEPKLMRNVITTGLVSRKKLSALYKIADAVVFPNVAPEPFGLVLIETMSAGKPLIGSAIGAIPEIIQNNVTGVLVKAGDANSLAKAIVEVLSDKESAKRLGKRGKTVVQQKFSEEVVLDRIMSAYKELTGRPRKKGQSRKFTILA